MRKNFKKNKKIIILCSIGVFILTYFICDAIYEKYQENSYQETYNNAYLKLFVEERNEVFKLYEEIASLLETPTESQYKKVYETTDEVEWICRDIFFLEMQSLVTTYGAGLGYYSCFFRDVKSAAESGFDTSKFLLIYDMLEKILRLYDDNSNPIEVSDKIKEMENFYQEISLLNEELEELNSQLFHENIE